MNPADRRVSNDPTAPNSHGRERMTARPAVLRALTDLFCLREDASDEEVDRYRELALQIIPGAGPSTRLYVAAKLARHPCAPPDVLEKLGENDPPCAALLAEHARNYPIEAQVNAALHGDRAEAVALARRAGLAAPVSAALIARNDPHVTRALAENPDVEITHEAVHAVRDDGRPDRIYADKLTAKAPPPLPPPETFLEARPDERMRVIRAARRATLGRPSTPVLRDAALIDQLQDFAIERTWDALAAALAHKTGLRMDVVSKLVRDAGGEPLALLLALVGVQRPEAVRILLCCDGRISHSFQRVRDLSLIAADTPATVAGALIFAMTGSRPRISTYAGAPERRKEPRADGARALEAQPLPAQPLPAQPLPTTKAAPASRTKVILRRRLP